MSQTRVHQFKKDLTFKTGDDNHIVGQRVKTGQVLKLTHLAAGFDELATAEYVVLGYYDGSSYIPLKKGAPAETGDLIHWDGEVWLREEQYYYAYLVNIGNNEVMRLRALGKWE